MNSRAGYGEQVATIGTTGTFDSSGETEELDLKGTTPVAIKVPAGLTAGNITFNVGVTSGDLAELRDSTGTVITLVVAVTAAVHTLPEWAQDFVGFRFIQVVGNAADDTETIEIISRPV